MTNGDLEEARKRYEAERAKRARAGLSDVLELDGALGRYRSDPWTPVESRDAVVDTVDAIVIGGGFGGLLCGAKLREAGVESVRLIDQAGDFGGVWYWNRYPGAQCDIESYIYMPLLEELGTIPTERYAHAPELLAHAKSIGRHFGLYDLALFQTTVTGARWHADTSLWEVNTDRGDRMMARYLVVAIGSLDKLRLPPIPGVETFSGHSFHTSRWDYAYTGGDNTGNLTGLRDKRVGIIGTGATALQCVPHLGEWSEEFFVIQRTPSTVAPRNNRPTDPEWAASLAPGWQAERVRNFSTIIAGGHQDIDLVNDSWTHLYTSLLHSDVDGAGLTPEERAELADLEMMESVRGRIATLVEDPTTASALMPYYRYLCKRPGFHDGYLLTFNRPNVHLVDTAGRGVERIVPEGVVVDGKLIELDCLVWATGFEWNTAYTDRWGFDVSGIDGVRLSDKWRDGMRTLHGLTTSGFPNFFSMPGPNSQSVVTSNFVHTLGENAAHIAYIVGAAQERGAKGFAVTDEGEDGWVQTILDHAVYEDEFLRLCTPSRFNNEGNPNVRPRLNTNFGGGPMEFFDLLSRWRSAGDLDGIELIH